MKAVKAWAVVELVAEIDARFVSGNEVPVERAHIKRSEWDALRAELLRPVTITAEEAKE